MTEHVTLSHEELDRLQIMTRTAERRVTQRHAGELLGLGERQIRRLYRVFKTHGAAGLVSARRGKPSQRQLPRETRCRALELIRSRYVDFGPDSGHLGARSGVPGQRFRTPIRGGWPRSAARPSGCSSTTTAVGCPASIAATGGGSPGYFAVSVWRSVRGDARDEESRSHLAAGKVEAGNRTRSGAYSTTAATVGRRLFAP
jgi:hypothetical protein